MRKSISLCPVCDGRMEPFKLRCSSCHATVEGDFPITRLGLLGEEHQRFVEAFLVARGNIREVERDLGISYPTVRKKLEEVVRALGYASEAGRMQQHEILDAIDRGELSPQEGIREMRAAHRS